ncbi:MAG: hypothetical protein GY725_09925 [bacterium]|nr:hypothetical protein [bacterium]
MRQLAYFIVLAGMLLGYYEMLGPGMGPSEIVEDLEWWRSAGYVHSIEAFSYLEELAEDGFPGAFIPLSIFWLPALLMWIWGFRLFRSAVLRAIATAGVFLLLIFPYYGYMADRVWRFFEWRSPAVAATFAGITAAGLFAPSLIRAAAGLSRIWTMIVLALVVSGAFVLTTEVTGTNSWMRFNISPWPVVTLFGLLLLGSAIASFHVAAGTGAWIAARLSGRRGLTIGGLAAAVLAAGLSWITLRGAEAGALIVFALIAACYTLGRVWLGPDDAEEASRRGLTVLLAGVFSLLTIQGTNRAATVFQKTARNETATHLLVALESYREKTGSFPRRLSDLVPDFFSEVPRPRIGLILDEDDEFMYRNLGDSYLLEFSSVQWVQCGYSPPFDVAKYDEEDFADEGEDDADDYDDYDDYEEEAAPVDPELLIVLADAGLEGSWNCEDAPPKLW